MLSRLLWANTEMTQATRNMKCGKAPGPDKNHPEFIKNLDPPVW